MSNGIYRPWIHGELVMEYKKSLTKMSHPPATVNGESQLKSTASSEVEEYQEPGELFERFLLLLLLLPITNALIKVLLL